MKRCITSFVSGSIVAREGDEYTDDDPAVSLMPSAFVDVKNNRSVVEQATAGPGEKRAVKRAAKKDD